MENYIKSVKEELKELIRNLSIIPAFSNHEIKRANYCLKWFKENGFEDVCLDDANNVIARFGVNNNNQIVVISAHTDVVFPDEDKLPFKEDNEHFYCLGVCDDTAQLAIMMIASRYFVSNNLNPKYGIIFAANTGEEGLGNLKGIRQIVKDYGNRIKEHITIDGTTIQDTVTSAVGSVRYQVTVNTKGGHSFKDFGSPNAIILLAEIINEINKIEIPKKENTITTYNIGTINGGTSVNTIAQEASMLCEYRSNDRECLKIMNEKFLEIFNKANKENNIKVEVVGERPCAGDVNQKDLEELIKKADDSVIKIGYKPIHKTSSTDSNIPLANNIPSVCIGACNGYGVHTREEYLDINSLDLGLKRVMLLLNNYFETNTR